MGLASMIDTAFATEKREKLKNIDAALRVYEYTSFYLRDYEGAILQVRLTLEFYAFFSSLSFSKLYTVYFKFLCLMLITHINSSCYSISSTSRARGTFTSARAASG